MTTKVCTKCKVEYPLSYFYADKRSPDGLQYNCKVCKSEMSRKWKENNPDKFKQQLRKYYDENSTKIKESSSRWRRSNLGRKNLNNSNRRAKQRKATPNWANEFFMAEIYHLAQLRTKLTGVEWHVDHIVPLTSKFVSGLHWEGNLQVIPAIENLRKNNKTWPNK